MSRTISASTRSSKRFESHLEPEPEPEPRPEPAEPEPEPEAELDLMPVQDFEETHLQLTWDTEYVGSAASTDAKGSYVFSDGDGKKSSAATKSSKISEGVISVIRSAETIQPGAVSRIQLRIGKNGAGGVGDFDLGITTVETAQRRSRLGEAA